MGAILLFLGLIACGDTEPVDDVDDTGEAPCELLETGTWQAQGSCFGMAMTATVTMDAPACSFTIDDWSMNHGDAPDGGAVDGDAVTLTGPGFDGCTGTVDGDAVAGTCDDGCAWELSR